MKKILILVFTLITIIQSVGQTFNSATSINIPAMTSTCVPITVSGIGAVSSTYGLEQVCIDLSISDAEDVHISLQSPDGNEYYLSYIEWYSGVSSNYSVCCFNSNSSNPIWLGTSPYNGTYQPETNLGTFNNGQDADLAGWNICFDNIGGSAATLNSSSLMFSSSPSTSCGAVAENDCSASPLICDFNGYCGTTSAFYTVPASEDSDTDLDDCGFSLNNNSWVEFVPSSADVSIDVVVEDCLDNTGVQFGVWESTDCSNFTNIGCAPSNPFIGTQTMNYSGLTPGNSYYLMIDGYAGDVCNYTFTVGAGSGVSVVEIDQGDALDACLGDDVILSVPSLPGVTYTWNWGSNTDMGSSITVPNANPPFVVSVTSAGVCNNNTDQIDINLDSNCCGAESGEWQ